MQPGLVVHVWWAELTAADAALRDRLPEAERARTLEPLPPADEGRRLVAAALLQHAVAEHRAMGRGSAAGARAVRAAGARAVRAAAPLEVDRACSACGAQHGRPVVEGGPHLSVAHAGLLVVVATCDVGPVGVDVERVARFDDNDPDAGPDLAATALATARRWVEHEALLKAGSHGPGALGDPGPSGGGSRARASLVPLTPPRPGYVAAIAAPRGTVVQVRDTATDLRAGQL